MLDIKSETTNTTKLFKSKSNEYLFKSTSREIKLYFISDYVDTSENRTAVIKSNYKTTTYPVCQ